MFNNPNYGQAGYGYIPQMGPAQARLAAMEAQYPQYTPGYGTTPGNFNGLPGGSQGPVGGFIKGRMVTSLDEVKGAMIDLDGGVHVFTDFGNHKVYTKQINLDGTATINTYSLDNPEQNQPPVPVNREEFTQIVNNLEQEIGLLQNQLKEVMSNVQSYADDGNAQRKGKSRTDGQ